MKDPQADGGRDVEIMRGGRGARARAKRRRHRVALALSGAVLAGAGAVLIVANLSGHPGATATPSPATTSTPSAPTGPASNLLLISVRSNPSLVAVAGSGGGRPPSALVIPSGFAAPSPGGLITVTGAASLPGAQFQTITSNALGLWIGGWVQMDLGGLAQLVDAARGIDVNMPDSLTYGTQLIGPGQAHLSGVQAAAYLNSATSSDRLLRWQAVLQGILTSGVPLTSASGMSSGNAQAAETLWTAAKGAAVDALPIPSVTSGPSTTSPIGVAEIEDSHFGTDAAQAVGVLILDTSGNPEASWTATTRMLKAGFRVVDYTAGGVGQYGPTKILAYTQDALAAGQRLEAALGVADTVYVTRNSNLADLELIIGKDFR